MVFLHGVMFSVCQIAATSMLLATSDLLLVICKDWGARHGYAQLVCIRVIEVLFVAWWQVSSPERISRLEYIEVIHFLLIVHVRHCVDFGVIRNLQLQQGLLLMSILKVEIMTLHTVIQEVLWRLLALSAMLMHDLWLWNVLSFLNLVNRKFFLSASYT